MRKGNSINLSANMWDSIHRNQLSKHTLKELHGVKLSPRGKLPMLTPRLKPHTQRFVNKIIQEVPKGKVNHADTIGFLERIISD